jgi:hypothetical protein
MLEFLVVEDFEYQICSGLFHVKSFPVIGISKNGSTYL